VNERKSFVLVELNDVRYLCNCTDNNIKEIAICSQSIQGCSDDDDLILSKVPMIKIKDFPAHSCTKIEDVDHYEDGIINFWVAKVEWKNGEVQEKIEIDNKPPSGRGLGKAGHLPEEKVELTLEHIN
jgi:hypothetical protein